MATSDLSRAKIARNYKPHPVAIQGRFGPHARELWSRDKLGKSLGKRVVLILWNAQHAG